MSGKVNEKSKMNFALSSKTQNHSVGVSTRDKHLLIGRFKAPKNSIILDAGKYLAQSTSQGIPCSSLSFYPSDSAHHVLTTRTPQKFQRSVDLIDRLTSDCRFDVTIFLDDFFDAPLTSNTRFRRFKERMRRVHLLNHLRTRARNIVLVKKHRHHDFLLRMANAFALNQGGTTNVNGHTCQILVKSHSEITADFSTTSGLSQGQERLHLRQHLFGLHNTQRMSAGMMIEHLDLLEEEDTELRDLALLAKAECLRKHPVIMRLRPQDRRFEKISTTPPPHPLLAVSQSLSGIGQETDQPISRYAEHLHAVFGLAPHFALNSPENARAFVHWYQEEAFERTPSLWVPPLIGSPDGSGVVFPVPTTDGIENSRAQQIAAFLSEPDDKQLEADLLEYLTHCPAPKGPSRMAILMALLAKLEGPLPVTVEETWQSTHILNWYNTKACQLFPFLTVFSKGTLSVIETEKPALKIIGMPNSHTGLGANMKMSAAMFDYLSIPHQLHDVDHKNSAILRENRKQTIVQREMVLHHINADRIPLTLMSPEHAYRNDQLHIGYLLWELSLIPDTHRLALDMLDEVWAPSHFVADLYRQADGPPVHLMKKGLFQLGTLAELPAPPKDKSIFTSMVCFDFHSSVERKNPLAAVQGFLSAFPRRHFSDCRLIVKTTPTVKDHWGDPMDQMGKIRALAAEDDRITVNDTLLSAADFWRYIQSADCLLSTHRGEGFGYLPAYAMALGIPIIGTDYGGTRDFCTPSTASPIAYSLVDVPEGHSIYPTKGARWAEVRRGDVATALRAIYDDNEQAKARARFGRAFVRREYSIEAYAARCKSRLLDLGVISD